MNLPRNRSRKNKRKGKLIPFLVGSILFHLLLLFVFAFYQEYIVVREKTPEKKPEFVEITEIPVPEDKETEPPEEPKRLAERSRKVPEEKTRDEFTKRGNVSAVPQPKQPPKPPEPEKPEKQPEKKPEQKAVEKPKPKEAPEEKKATQKPQPLPEKEVASIPRETTREPRREAKPVEKPTQKEPSEITKEDLLSARPSNPSENREPSRELLGSRDVEKKEDTVDLSTTEFKYLSYFLKLKRQIEGVWDYPEVSRVRGEQGQLRVIFTIRKNGTLESVRLLDSSGYGRLDDEAMRAIRVASPFSPFPQQWGELERLNIRAVFVYQLGYWKLR